MKNYSSEVRAEAHKLFDRSFNCLSFELLKKAIGEEAIFNYIQKPSEDKIFEEYVESQGEDCLRDDFSQARKDDKDVAEQFPIYGKDDFWEWLKDNFEDVINEWWLQQEHYPMWGTIFEAKGGFLSDKIIKDVDILYDLGIGVISPTDHTSSCLFIAGAGYSFFSTHWIPMFVKWGWLNVEEIEKEAKLQRLKEKKERRFKPKLSKGKTIEELINWNNFTETLLKLSRNRDETIKRHSEGLLKALKL